MLSSGVEKLRHFREGSRLRDVKHVSLHVGAHRTATTRLQTLLDANAARLLAAGVAVATPAREGKREVSTVRDVLLPHLRHAPNRAPVRLWRERRWTRRHLREFVPAGAHHLVLSEESVLEENAQKLVSGNFYGDVGERCGELKRLIAHPVTRVCLGIRSYDVFWPSLYGIAAKAGPLPDFDELCPAMASARRGWPDVVADLRQVFPCAQVIVWPQETYSDRKRLEDLLGPGCDAKLEVRQERVNEAISRAAIHVLQKRHREGRLKWSEADEIVRSHPVTPSNPRLDGFDDAGRTALKARYAEDLATIRSRGDVIVA